VVGDRQGKGDRGAPGPAMDGVVESAGGREVEQAVDAGRRHKLADGQDDRRARQPHLHVDGVAKEEVEVAARRLYRPVGNEADGQRHQGKGDQRDRQPGPARRGRLHHRYRVAYNPAPLVKMT
jgi:hypothetical protein